MTAKDVNDLNRIKSLIPSIKHYLDAAQPVIESNILMDKLRDTSLKDAMTGLYNRRFLEEFIDQVMKQVQREKETYTVLMLDVDFFKQVNDTYGHDVGDEVIKRLASIMKNSVRDSDMPVRYGGEEFIILLMNSTEEKTYEIAKKINEDFAKEEFSSDIEIFKKTVSIGIANYPIDAKTLIKSIKCADEALYVAKKTGRNKIIKYENKEI
jgi:diguanylate cyclase (GGDEF)-like protein